MKIETEIKLDRWKPRDYQIPIFDAILNKGYKRVLAIWPRRAGKDMAAFNLAFRQCLKSPQIIYYIFPTYSQAKKALWDAITNEGKRVLDFIPSELVEQMYSTELKIRFINGSILQFVGSDNYDGLMGTNPKGIVFSEYSLQDPQAYQYLRPILTANNGWALFLSTPRGKNHLWELYNIAKESKLWYVSHLTLHDTQHINMHEIEREKTEGIMSDDLIQQEYFTSFAAGVEGSYYGKYINKMRLKGQIGIVPYEPGFKVITVWDIGVRDSTTILFVQIIGQTIRVVDSYENSKVGLEHYVSIIKQKEYIYGKHVAPHDIQVREFSSGMARIDKARQLGISFTPAPNLSLEDGIEAVRSNLSKIWIDERSCANFIKAIENYRQEWDAAKKIYRAHPLHDWSSHWADALRYLCVSLPKVRDGLTPEELDKRFMDARYGNQSNLPRFFQDDKF